jgi:hypothetical protein
MSYIDELADAIRSHVPKDALPPGENRDLFLIYAAVGLAKGQDITHRDVHNAWSAWMATRDPSHESIKPYDELDPDVKREDDPYVIAIRTALERSAE